MDPPAFGGYPPAGRCSDRCFRLAGFFVLWRSLTLPLGAPAPACARRSRQPLARPGPRSNPALPFYLARLKKHGTAAGFNRLRAIAVPMAGAPGELRGGVAAGASARVTSPLRECGRRRGRAPRGSVSDRHSTTMPARRKQRSLQRPAGAPSPPKPRTPTPAEQDRRAATSAPPPAQQRKSATGTRTASRFLWATRRQSGLTAGVRVTPARADPA
jgi:hypothetical protein